MKRSLAGARHGVASGPPTTALCRGLADMRGDEPFVLEPCEGFVDRSEGQVASGASLDLVVNRHPIGAFADAKDGEEDDLFEFTKHAVGSLLDIV